MHISCQKQEFQYRGMRSMNLHFSLRKVILLSVLLNCVVPGLSSALIIILSGLFFFNNNGLIGFFGLCVVVLLPIPIAGIIAGFKIGDLYILIYNIFAGLLNMHKIELNNR